jgi:hypothetical protein
MDDMGWASEGGRQDRTEPYGAGPYGFPEPTAALASQSRPRASRGRSARATRWAAGLVAAALLVGGGTVLGVELSGTGSSAKSGTGAHGKSQTPAGSAQAAALSDVLGNPASLSSAVFAGAQGAGTVSAAPGSAAAGAVHRCRAAARHLLATGHRGKARAALRLCGRRLLVFRALAGALHGQITFRAPHGTKTVAFERGVIQSVSASEIVVKASDGTTLTWELVSKTVVVKAGHRAPASALVSGQTVFAAGPVTGGADDARLIVVRR